MFDGFIYAVEIFTGENVFNFLSYQVSRHQIVRLRHKRFCTFRFVQKLRYVSIKVHSIKKYKFLFRLKFQFKLDKDWPRKHCLHYPCYFIFYDFL